MRWEAHGEEPRMRARRARRTAGKAEWEGDPPTNCLPWFPVLPEGFAICHPN